MIVMTPLNGLGSMPTTHADWRRRNAAQVHRLGRDASGSYLQVSRLRGLGALDSVPTWAWGAGGGLVAGLLIGAVVFKKKRR